MKNHSLHPEQLKHQHSSDFVDAESISPRRRDVMFSLLLTVATRIPYWQTASFGCVNFDDPSYVFENPLLRDGLTPERVRDAIFGFHESNWHPLVWISYMVEVDLFGMNPGMMHITNVGLHIANSLLLYFWLRRATGDAVRSFCAALIFALHPMHVESVAWITERKDVLSTLFFFLTLAAWTEYTGGRRWRWYLAALFFFAVGLTAKSMLVTVPAVLLLLDIWPLHRLRFRDAIFLYQKTIRPLLFEKVPFVALSAINAVFTILAQRSGGAVAGITHFSFQERLANAVVSFNRYILKSFWPSNLSVFYPIPKDGWNSRVVLLSVVVLAGVSIAVCAARKNRTGLSVGWSWFIITMLPVIGLIQVGSQSMADRYTYVPMTGLALMLLWSLPDKCFQLSRFSILSLAVPTLLLLGLTARQVSFWQDSITLFEHAVSVAPENNFIARSNLGIAYSDAGKFGDAAIQLEKALGLSPADAGCLANMARNYNRAGEYQMAETLLTAALQKHPDDAHLWLHLGNSMRGLQKPESAIECYKQAVMHSPKLADALNNLGVMLCRTDNQAGMQYIRQAIAADPMNAQAHNSLGNALVRQGDFPAAEESYLRAIKLGAVAEARQNLKYLQELTEKSSHR